MYKEMYTLAYAITGCESGANEILLSVMCLTGTKLKRGRVIALIKKVALEYENEGEYAFECLNESEELELLTQTDDDTRRAAFLRFGCGLDIKQISRILDISLGNVRSKLNAAIECTKNCGGEKAIRRECIREIKRASNAPDAATIERALESRISQSNINTKHNYKNKLVNVITSVILLIIIGLLIWTGAVLADYFRQTQVTSEAPQTQAEDVYG